MEKSYSLRAFHYWMALILLALSPISLIYSAPVDDNFLADPPTETPVAKTLGDGGPNAANDANPLGAKPNAPPNPREAVELHATNLFQDFILKTRGRVLPRYGETLFESSKLFGERKSATVPAQYIVGPGDELFLKIYGSSVDFDKRVTVDREGMIVLPKIGPVSVVGIAVGDLESYLKRHISKVLSHFSLFVTMGQLRGIEIYVVGQARFPGKYVVGSLSTLINAVFETGGPNSNGSMRAIQLVRDSKVVATVDLYDFLVRGDTSKDRRLLSGDVINIPIVGQQVAILGAVPAEGIFELKTSAQNSIKDLLPFAGGLQIQATTFEASLERTDSKQAKPIEVKKLALSGSDLDTTLKDGDILSLFPIKAAVDNAVTLRILQADPVRVPIKEGTRVKDVIPSRDVLLTSDYFVRRSEFLIPADERTQTVKRKSELNEMSHQGPVEKEEASLKNHSPGVHPIAAQTEQRLRTLQLDEINWDQAIIERVNASDFKMEVLAFNLAKAIEGEDQNNLPLRPGDTLTIFSQRDVRMPIARRNQIVKIQGEIKAPGFYQIAPGETLPALIGRAGGLTENAYLYGTELSRQSVKARQKEHIDILTKQLESRLTNYNASNTAKISQGADATSLTIMNQQNVQLTQNQIAKLKEMEPNGRISLEIDPEEPKYPDFALEDGDQISVPSRPGYVSALGAVYNENVLIFHPGNKVSDYLKVAGVTPFAERDDIFVLRADGSILSANDHNVNKAVLFPGDAIVVPEKYYTESGYSLFMRGLRDWTQVLGTLGLSAAAIHVLAN